MCARSTESRRFLRPAMRWNSAASWNALHCHHTMDTHFYYGGGHAVMEIAKRCELNWLDGGALMRIVRAPHSEEAAD